MQDPLPTLVLTTEELSRHCMAYTFSQVCVLCDKQIAGERKGQFVHGSDWCDHAKHC